MGRDAIAGGRPDRDDQRRLAVDLLAVDFRAADFFLPVDFLAVDFLAVDFLAVDFFRPVDFLAVDFLAVDFFRPVDFLAVDFLAVDFFRPVDFLTVDFLVEARFGERPPARAARAFTFSATSSALPTAASFRSSTRTSVTSCAASVDMTFFPIRLPAFVTFFVCIVAPLIRS